MLTQQDLRHEKAMRLSIELTDLARKNHTGVNYRVDSSNDTLWEFDNETHFIVKEIKF